MTRNADTMSDAIALSSPSGKMSKRAKTQALARLSQSLWPNGCTKEDIYGKPPPQPTRREKLLAQAVRLRDLAASGMSVKKFQKEATRLETLACNDPQE